jgi:hypothetical protein
MRIKLLVNFPIVQEAFKKHKYFSKRPQKVIINSFCLNPLIVDLIVHFQLEQHILNQIFIKK